MATNEIPPPTEKPVKRPFLVSQIPNFLTCCNVLCGLRSIQSSTSGSWEFAIWLVVAGHVFDALDGPASRFLKCYSPIGKMLDTLGDFLTFGIAPAFVICGSRAESSLLFRSVVGFAFTFGCVYRLCRFCVEPSPPGRHVGLCSPFSAQTLVLAFLVLEENGIDVLGVGEQAMDNTAKGVLVALVTVVSLMMTSRVDYHKILCEPTWPTLAVCVFLMFTCLYLSAIQKYGNVALGITLIYTLGGPMMFKRSLEPPVVPDVSDIDKRKSALKTT